MPAAGPDHGHGPGESRFVEEKRHYEKPHPDQRPRLPRPRALHPVRPLHPLRQGGGRRPAHPLHQPGQRDAGHHLPRRAVRVVLQRQHRADLPGRRAHGQALPLQGPPVGPRARPSPPARRARSAAASPSSRAATSCCATRASTSTRSTGAGCATRAASTSRPSTATSRLARAARARQGEAQLVEAPWAEALDAAAERHPRGAGRPAARRRSPSSAAPAAPTRTPTPGPSWPRASSAPTTSTPSSATACRPRSSSACRRPRSTRLRAATTVRAPRARPQGGAAGPVPAAARRRPSGVAPASSSWAAHDTGLTRYAWQLAAPPAGRAGRAGRAARYAGTRTDGGLALDDDLVAESASSWARARSRSSSAGRPSRRVGGLRRRRRRRPARRSPEATFLPALRRGNVRGALDMGLAPGLLPGGSALDDAGGALRAAWPLAARPSGGLDAAGILEAAADGRIDCLVLLGADPLADFPDRDLAGAALAGAGHGHRGRHLPHRVVARRPTWCWPPPASPRRRAPPPTSRVGSAPLTPEGHAPRHRPAPTGSSPPSWPAPRRRPRPRLGRARSGTRCVASVPRTRRSAVAALAADRDGVLLDRARAVHRRRLGRRATAPAQALRAAGSLVSRTLYDAGVVVAAVAVAGRRWRPAARLRVNPCDADRLGVADGHAACRCRAARRPPLVARRSARSAACRGAWPGCAFNQPGVAAGRAGRRRGAPSIDVGRRDPAGVDADRCKRAAPRDPALRRATSSVGREVIIVILKVVVAFVFLLVAVIFMIWFERKVIADMQNRIGPNQAGPVGHPPDAGRRHQARSSRRPPPGARRALRLPAGAVPLARAGVPRRSRSSRSAATSPTATTASCQHLRPRHAAAGGRPADRHPASCWPCARSPSTASCSPAGRRARSTRCSARCGRRPRWSATRPRSACRSPPSCW